MLAMEKCLTRGLPGLVLLLAAVLRLTGLDWDAYRHYHPDERYIAWVATTIEWPTDWRTAFDSARSSFNPYHWPPGAASAGIVVPQDAQRRFAYGHLPLYLGVAAARLAERVGPALTPHLPPGWALTRDVLNGAGMVEFRHLTAVARALTALFDVATVLVLFLLGRLLFNKWVGLLAAAFLALNVMHMQLAHFFTSDPYLTFFVVTAVYWMVRGAGRSAAQGSRGAGGQLLLAAVFVGLAVGSKFSAVLLFLPLGLAFWLRKGRWMWGLATAVLVAFLAFSLTNPFAVLDFSCRAMTPTTQVGPITIPAINLRSCYLDNITTQSRMVRGDVDLDFTRQYQGTLPYLYPLEMQLRWGMGPLLGVAALLGLGWVAWRGLKNVEQLKNCQWSMVNGQLLIVLAWVLPFLLTTAGFYVKFMRYLQPVTPFLLLFAAAFLMQLPWRRVRIGLVGLVLGGTAVWAAAFMGIYSQPHPWVLGSQWIYAHVEPGALILSERWDDPLPTSMEVDGVLRRRAEFKNEELTWLTGTGEKDDALKLAANLTLLAQADYLVLTSNRVYGVVPRLPQAYPLSSQYHQLLFDGALGYELVAVYGRFLRLGNFYIKPETFAWPGLTPPPAVTAYLDSFSGITWGRADESFTVYDQPLTMIWQNVERKTAEELLEMFRQP